MSTTQKASDISTSLSDRKTQTVTDAERVWHSLYRTKSCCSVTSLDSFGFVGSCDSLSSLETATVAQLISSQLKDDELNCLDDLEVDVNKENVRPTKQYKNLEDDDSHGYALKTINKHGDEIETDSSDQMSLDKEMVMDPSSTEDQQRVNIPPKKKSIRKRKKSFIPVGKVMEGSEVEDNGNYYSKREFLPFSKRTDYSFYKNNQERSSHKHEKRLKARTRSYVNCLQYDSNSYHDSSDCGMNDTIESGISDDESNYKHQVSKSTAKPELFGLVKKKRKAKASSPKEDHNKKFLSTIEHTKMGNETSNTFDQSSVNLINKNHQSVPAPFLSSSDATKESIGVSTFDVYSHQQSMKNRFDVSDTSLNFGDNPQDERCVNHQRYDNDLAIAKSIVKPIRSSLSQMNNIPLKMNIQLGDIATRFPPSLVPSTSMLNSCFQDGGSHLREKIDGTSTFDIDRTFKRIEADVPAIKSNLSFCDSLADQDYLNNDLSNNNHNNYYYNYYNSRRTTIKANYPPLPKCKKNIPPIRNDFLRVPTIIPPRKHTAFNNNVSTNNCLDTGHYTCKEIVGEGSYGLVYKAVDNRNNTIVAIKQVPFSEKDEGIPCTAIREISILRSCSHPNIVSIMDITHSVSGFATSARKCCHCSRILSEDYLGGKVCPDCNHMENNLYDGGSLKTSHLHMILEFVPLDLKKYMDQIFPSKINSRLLRHLMHQLLTGIEYCHSKRILHRDLKPQNLLLEPNTMTLKIADFGLSRVCNPQLRSYTNEVVTLWYRCPELLLGIKKYSYPVDIWSIAVIFAELSNSKPLFPGDSEIDQLFRIFQKLGTPNEETWNGVTAFRYYLTNFPLWKPQDIHSIAPDLDLDGIELLQNILVYEPDNRWTCSEALKCTYFEDIDSIREEISTGIEGLKYN